MRITLLFISLLLFACTSDKSNSEKVVAKPNSISNQTDYNAFLNKSQNKNYDVLINDLKFWEDRYENNDADFISLVKMAGDYSAFFEINGNVEDLIAAEKALIAANEITDYNKASYLRALARNYISQHKFKEALELLQKAEESREDIASTQKMLFDVHLELGNKKEAEEYLGKVKNMNDFTYLIRTSKWNDHKGNLEGAIKYLEQATVRAEADKNEKLMAWCYTNIADYYGHAGEIKKSYNHYLKALQLNSTNAYAKKGIAWIVFSKERDVKEANRILNEIIKTHNSPDYYLLKSEIAEFEGNQEKSNENQATYLSKVENPLYGNMYNKYLILLYAEDSSKLDRALELANKEIANRPTPQSYNLKAWALYKSGNLDSAYAMVKNHVYGHTYEPEPLMHTAIIAKAYGDMDLVNELKPELEGAFYELGPLAELEIKKL